MSFGSMVKSLRKERNLTQDQLANLLNVTPQAISRWENNAAMPDISLLIPIANVFQVSTDTLLEVNVQKNEEIIRELVQNAIILKEPYGNTLEEKLDLYREKVRQFPDSVELKDALISILTALELRQGAFPDPAIYREIVSLTEDIIDAGGGKKGVPVYKSYLVEYMKKLKNAQGIKEIASDSQKMEVCREVLLPASLSGREQVDARKALIFKCTDVIINTVYDLFADNSEILTEEEWNALASAESVVEAIYGKSFSEHFILASLLYKGVQGALRRGKIEEAIKRLRIIVERLKIMETEPVQISPLIQEEQIEVLSVTYLTVNRVSNAAKWLKENIEKDFLYEGAPRFREKYPQFEAACRELDRLMDSKGGQTEKYAWESLRHMDQRE